MTNDIKTCPMYRAESANVKSKYYCKPPSGYLRARQINKVRQNLPLNQVDCEVLDINLFKTLLQVTIGQRELSAELSGLQGIGYKPF